MNSLNVNFKKIRSKIFSIIRPEELIMVIALFFLIIAHLALAKKFIYQPGFPVALFSLIIVISAAIPFFHLIKNLLILSKKEIRWKMILQNIYNFLRSWIPLVIGLVIYDQIHAITREIRLCDGNLCEIDNFLIKIDKILFLGHHPTLIFEKFITPFLTSYFNFFYDMYVWLIPITMGIFYFKYKNKFHDLLLSFTISLYGGLIGYILFPCVGPVLAQNSLYTTHLYGGLWYNSLAQLYIINRNAFHCFPSLHFANSFIFLYFVIKYTNNKYLKYIFLFTIINLWISTLYLRWHYVIDLIAGLALALLATYLSPKINRLWKRLSKTQKVLKIS